MKYFIFFLFIVLTSCCDMRNDEGLLKINYSYYPDKTLNELYYYKVINNKKIKNGDCLLFKDRKLIRHTRFKMGIYDGLQEIIVNVDNYIKHVLFHNGNIIWSKIYNSNSNNLVTFCSFKDNKPYNGQTWTVIYAKLAKHSLIYEFDKGKIINIFWCDDNGLIIEKADEAPPFRF